MRNDTAKIKLSDDSREIYFDEGMSSHSLSKDASRRFMETMHDVDNMLLAELAGLTLDDLDVTLKKAVLHVMEMRHSLINDNSYYADNMRNYDLLLSNLALLHCYTIRSLLLAHIELGHININLTVDESNDVLGSMMQKDLTQLREEQAKKVQIVQPHLRLLSARGSRGDAIPLASSEKAYTPERELYVIFSLLA